MSLRGILDQVLEKLDLTYMGGEPFFTRGLKFQAKLTFYMPNQLNSPFSIFIILNVTIKTRLARGKPPPSIKVRQ
jgi:hypothetical protein